MAAALYCLANKGRIQKVANYFGTEKSASLLCFYFRNFPLYLFNKLFCNIAISLIENHTELAYLLTEHVPANIFLVKVNNKNTRQRCEICSKLKLKTPEPFSSVFIVHFEQANVS